MSIELLSLIIFIGGLLVLVYGIFFSPTEEEERIINSTLDFEQVDKLINNLQTHVLEADKILIELDKFSTHITGQLEEKHNELLLFFQLVDEKFQKLQKEEARIEKEKEAFAKIDFVDKIPERIEMPIPHISSGGFIMPKPAEPKPLAAASHNSTFDEVAFMFEKGKNVDEIARTLGKGKGEIRLMLDLMGKEG